MEDKTMAMLMSIAKIMSKDATESNERRVGLLKAKWGDYINLPENWDTLDESVKSERLDKIEAMFKEDK